MKSLAITLLLLVVMLPESLATRLMELSQLDRRHLVVWFRDGEARFRDDGRGMGAYGGHDYAEGSDSLVRFGETLDVSSASRLTAFNLVSEDDPTYGGNGLHPVNVHRKSKVTQTTHDWEYAHDHWLFLELPHPLQPGAEYTLEVDPSTNSDRLQESLTFDVFRNLSEAIHVNMIGYVPGAPLKSADLYAWMGDGGPRDYSDFEGKQVWLFEPQTGEKHPVGEVRFWKGMEPEAEAHGRNLTGSPVWNVDFSSFSEPGTYRLVVEDVGCSREFDIREDAYFEPFRTSTRGYYYMRLGEDRMDMVPVPRRPLFIPGEDPEGFTIYITDLHPFRPEWREHRGDTWDEPHFKPARESMFWKRRLPGNPVNPHARGGHSDAFDWDRHIAHVSNIYDLLLPYILTGGAIGNDNLEIGESGNGIPDVMDEARNEVDFWLSVRHGKAYGHGITNPSREYNIMFQAGTTTMAAWANAANCAMMAECFRISGHPELEKYYTREAITAFEFASDQENLMLDDRQDIGNSMMRGRDFRLTAAAYLYNVTGDSRWEEIIDQESAVRSQDSKILGRGQGNQVWATAAYLFTPRERNYPGLYDNMVSSVKNQAKEHNVQHMELRPSRRTSNNNYWQTTQDLHLVLLAHAISEDPQEKRQLERAMLAEADWGLGRNPSNIVEMTGLGERHIIHCYTTGHNDGTPGVHPGHTPYNNLDPWGGDHNGSNPRWFTEKCYPEWGPGGWPHQEGHFNSRYSWANGEFTPRQTMRGKQALYGYLYGIYGT